MFSIWKDITFKHRFAPGFELPSLPVQTIEITWKKLATSCVLVSLVLCLAGCSIFAGSPVTSLALPDERAVGAFDATVRFERIRSEPNLYRKVSRADSATYSVFVTALQECEITESLSSVATTRQLLVGLRNIVIERQEDTYLNNTPVLVSVLRATLDGEALKLGLFTIRNADCVTDYVLWLADVRTSAETVERQLVDELFERELDSFSPYLTAIVPDTMSARDTSRTERGRAQHRFSTGSTS